MAAVRGLRAVTAAALMALAVGVLVPGIVAAVLLVASACWAWPYGDAVRVVEGEAREAAERGPRAVAAPHRAAAEWRAAPRKAN